MTSIHDEIQINCSGLQKRIRTGGNGKITSYSPSAELFCFQCHIFCLRQRILDLVWHGDSYLPLFDFLLIYFRITLIALGKKPTHTLTPILFLFWVLYCSSFIDQFLIVMETKKCSDSLSWMWLITAWRDYFISLGLFYRTEAEINYDFQEFLSPVLPCSFKIVANNLQW